MKPDGKGILEDGDPLFEAVKPGDCAAVEARLKAGVSVYAESAHNPTLASLAVHSGALPLVKLLIKNGLDVRRPFNRFGEPLLFLALRSRNLEMVELLLNNGEDVNAKDKFKFTALHRSSGGAPKEVTEFLLQRGADVATRAQGGDTPLMHAARSNS